MYVDRINEIYNEGFCFGFGQKRTFDWSENDAVNNMSEVEYGQLRYFWLSDPKALGEERSPQEVVYAMTPLALNHKNKVMGDYWADPTDLTKVSRKANKSKSSFDLAGEKLTWHATLGTKFASGIALFGKRRTNKKAPPEGTTVVEADGKTYIGVMLANLNQENRYATVSENDVKAATKTVKGAWSKDYKLFFLPEAKIISSTQPSVAAVVEDEKDDNSVTTEMVLKELNELAMDAILPGNFKFSKCYREKKFVHIEFTLEGNEQSTFVVWDEPLGKDGTISSLLIEMLSDELSALVMDDFDDGM